MDLKKQPKLEIIKREAVVDGEQTAAVMLSGGAGGEQQIYIIQTTDAGEDDGASLPVGDSAEVVVSDDLAVYETVSALEQLSRGPTADGAELIQVYEEVVLPESDFVDVAEVEVGDGRSASPVKLSANVPAAVLAAAGITPSNSSSAPKRKTKKERAAAAAAAAAQAALASATPVTEASGEFHICRVCNQFVPVMEVAQHNLEHHGAMTSVVGDLVCSDCGKLFKSKRSLFGHKKEKHSGVTEVHSCPECGKTFGRKSNLKAHRESLHYGKKFPCQFCDRIFTNRSSMNQHIKKTHAVLAANDPKISLI